jgi:predicted dienelactone hydrolase
LLNMSPQASSTLAAPLLLTLFLAGCATAQPAPSGPLPIETVEFGDLVDDARNRRVPIKVHLPQGTGRHPLVVFSPGAAGNWDSFLFHGRDLASHGYVALCVEHVASNTDRVKELAWEGDGWVKERSRKALLRVTTDPEAVLGRPRDVSFAIDRAEAWDARHAALKGRIDTSKIVVLGHSFGAYTTLAICGARPILDHLRPPVAPGAGLAKSLADPRVTAGVAMSPQGPGTSRFSRASYKTIDRPLLCFTGTKDEQFSYDGKLQAPKTRLEAFELMPPGEKTFLVLENADHMAFAEPIRAGWLFGSKAREDTIRITRALTLHFCNAVLKGDPRAKARLTKETAQALCGDVVTRVTWHEK